MKEIVIHGKIEKIPEMIHIGKYVIMKDKELDKVRQHAFEKGRNYEGIDITFSDTDLKELKEITDRGKKLSRKADTVIKEADRLFFGR